MARIIKKASGENKLKLTSEEWAIQGLANGWIGDSHMKAMSKFAQEEISDNQEFINTIDNIDSQIKIAESAYEENLLAKFSQRSPAPATRGSRTPAQIAATERMQAANRARNAAKQIAVSGQASSVPLADTSTVRLTPKSLLNQFGTLPAAVNPSGPIGVSRRRGAAAVPAAVPAAAMPNVIPRSGNITPYEIASDSPQSTSAAQSARASAPRASVMDQRYVVNDPRTGKQVYTTPNNLIKSLEKNRFGDAARVNFQRIESLPPDQKQAFYRQLSKTKKGQETLRALGEFRAKGIGAPKGGIVQRIDPATGKPISQIGALGQKIKGMPGQAVGALGKKFPQGMQNVKSVAGGLKPSLGVGGMVAGLGGAALGVGAYQWLKSREVNNQQINPKFMVDPNAAQKAFMASAQIKNLNSLRGVSSSIDSSLDKLNAMLVGAVSKIQQGQAGQGIMARYQAQQNQPAR